MTSVNVIDFIKYNSNRVEFKVEPKYSFRKSQNEMDFYGNTFGFIKYDQNKSKELVLICKVTSDQIELYNKKVPKIFQVQLGSNNVSYDDFIKILYTKCAELKLSKYNDISDIYIKLSLVRDKLWQIQRDSDNNTNDEVKMAYKLNDTVNSAGPNKVSPINLEYPNYWVSYMISLVQSILVCKALFDGIVVVNEKYRAIGYLLGFGNGGFRSSLTFDNPSIFYQPRRAMQYDMLKQFDDIFQTVDQISYSLIFSQVTIPLIIVYLYYSTKGLILQTNALQAQFLIIIVQFKVIQEVMVALKVVFSYAINLNPIHFIKTVAGEIHECKMSLFWFLLPGLTTVIIIISYIINIGITVTRIIFKKINHEENNKSNKDESNFQGVTVNAIITNQ